MKKILVIFIIIGLSSCKHYYCIEYENTTNGYTTDIQNQWGGFYPQDHIDKLNSEPQHYHCYED